MIKAVAIPILVKAVEFLFGEGCKILRERRERRKDQQKTHDGGLKTPIDLASRKDEIIESKEAALDQAVIESRWFDSETNVKHLLSLLRIQTKSYYLAKEQYAKWGSALVPPIIVYNLTEAEDEIAKTTKDLQRALSRIYGKEVFAPEAEQS